MARVARLVVAAAIALPLAAATGGRAVACSCAPSTARETIHRADAIVAGHVVNQVAADAMNTRTTVVVDGVYKGDVAAEITLVANIGSGGGSSCAVLYPVGATVDPLVLSRHDDGTYVIPACTFLTLDAVRARLGQAGPPPPVASPTGGGSIAAAPPSVVDPRISWLAVLGGLAMALLLMSWALRRAHRERVVRAAEGVTQLQALARASRDQDDPDGERGP
jgi:hypothetical protein